MSDFSGAVLAVLQIILDHYRVDDGKGFWEDLNQAKFLCTTISVMCTMIFLFQHFVLFGAQKTNDDRKSVQGGKSQDMKERLMTFNADDIVGNFFIIIKNNRKRRY